MKSVSYWKPYWKINAVLRKGARLTKRKTLPEGTKVVIDAFKATCFNPSCDNAPYILLIHIIEPCHGWIVADAVEATA